MEGYIAKESKTNSNKFWQHVNKKQRSNNESRILWTRMRMGGEGYRVGTLVELTLPERHNPN